MKHIRRIIMALVLLLSLVGTPIESQAQCPMCKMSAQSNLENGGTQGKGLNVGILYLLVLPYILVGGIGYWWWKNRKTEEDQAIDELLEQGEAKTHKTT